MGDLSEEQWHSFSEYLGRALELPESERIPWLAELAGASTRIPVSRPRLSVRSRIAAGTKDMPSSLSGLRIARSRARPSSGRR